jgi:hypothetical protein
MILKPMSWVLASIVWIMGCVLVCLETIIGLVIVTAVATPLLLHYGPTLSDVRMYARRGIAELFGVVWELTWDAISVR